MSHKTDSVEFTTRKKLVFLLVLDPPILVLLYFLSAQLKFFMFLVCKIKKNYPYQQHNKNGKLVNINAGM